jgi:putative aldouronate transport system substrate-binding protein
MKTSGKLLRKAALLLITASLAAIAALCVSCQKQQGVGMGGQAEAQKTVDYSQHETFTIWLQADANDYYSDYSDNPVIWALNRKFNITLKFEQPVRGSERDAMSLMFGTGEYTDMIEMSNYTGSLVQLYEDGVIVDIAQYLDYMPNFKRILDTNEGYRRATYNDDGKILQLRGIDAEDAHYVSDVFVCWGGMVYRYDILDATTGGNVQFPSGNDYPKTIDDWEYMLPIFKSYFEARGAVDYAPLIIPYNGYIYYGDFLTSFDAAASDYIEDGKVKNGFYEDTFYKYLAKMREWYGKGWIYKDFASRTNDMFFLPNTALTYGGNAGAWFGLNGQVGDAMSMPQYGMFFDVRAVPSPLSTEEGITEFTNFMVKIGRAHV